MVQQQEKRFIKAKKNCVRLSMYLLQFSQLYYPVLYESMCIKTYFWFLLKVTEKNMTWFTTQSITEMNGSPEDELYSSTSRQASIKIFQREKNQNSLNYLHGKMDPASFTFSPCVFPQWFSH